ncbi:hypothetical protein FHY35_001379 [Xanthomonas arboricola]|uniref:hypothetical protein n=1 Tax=Xanthomonas arboricola TaxID=56448 RepID=UPI00141B6D0A|nr:hypothetical protein [Xanthomonas arboricola]NIJ84424.1 hypothetical protein [Xanthomonas arboricola]
MNEQSGNSGQLQPRGAAAGMNEPFGDSEQLGTGAGSAGDALPPLPESNDWGSYYDKNFDVFQYPTYTVEQMQDYARAALAARQPVGVEPARISSDMVDGELSVASAIDQVVELFPSADRAALRILAACLTHHSIHRYTTPPAPAAVSWDWLRGVVSGMHVRYEPIGGQTTGYVQRDEVLGWIEEGKRRTEHAAAAPISAPAAVPVDATYSLDADPVGIRSRVADCITGTMMVGAQNHTPPPAGHWLEPFWKMAQADAALSQPAAVPAETFQAGVSKWMGECFLPSLYSNMTERGDRQLEEVLELLQSNGYEPARVATLVDYVYGRPVGEPAQEVGGVMVTLAGYCWVAGLDMHAEGARELERITQPEVMAKIRRKQEAKNALHFDTPLPGHATHPQPAAACVNIDAMRYLYLRAQPVEGGPWGTPRIAIPSSERAGEFANGDDADAAIDAAIAAQQAKPEVGNG